MLFFHDLAKAILTSQSTQRWLRRPQPGIWNPILNLVLVIQQLNLIALLPHPLGALLC